TAPVGHPRVVAARSPEARWRHRVRARRGRLQRAGDSRAGGGGNGSTRMIHEVIHDNGVAELVIDAPPVNAYGQAEIAALIGHLRSYGAPDADPERVKVVVLRGEGKGFCGG